MADREQFLRWLQGWDPQPATSEDPIDPRSAQALASVLDAPFPEDGRLPPLWHWVYFLDWAPTAALGEDGHPATGVFLPPLPDRTRMFGGGRVELHGPLRVGEPARRRSAVVHQEVKQGATGTLLFVTVRHEIEQHGRLAITDEQDVMYRSGAPSVPRPAPRSGPPTVERTWDEPFRAGPLLLFRFSALTANAHRIHYDHPYATGVEGYGNLVVHGPLLAVALAGLVSRRAPGRRIASMRYRFIRPALSGEALHLVGHPDPAGTQAALAVLADDGQPRATGAVSFA